MTARTMFDKIWDAHVVREAEGQPSLLYVDLHLVHEVTSPQAFEGLRMAGRRVRRPDLTVATMDHNTPTWELSRPITDPIAAQQLEHLERNCNDFGVTLYDRFSPYQGIVHVIGPEQGYTQPGQVIVCGDSHTSTHGAFGAFAIGIGTSEVEHVLATQTLRQFKPKTMEIRVDGPLPAGVSAKDVILCIIGRIGVAGATGHAIEYTGEGIRQLSMEGRMTVCNMSIEGGGRAGMVAPDQTTFDYMRGRPQVPQGADFDLACDEWAKLATDDGAEYDTVVVIPSSDIEPYVSWGTNPGMVAPVTGRVPNPNSYDDEGEKSQPSEPWTTWVSNLILQSRTSVSTGYSSGPARTLGLRTSGWQPMWPAARKSRTACTQWSYRVLHRSRHRQKRKAWIAYSPRRDSTGA